jgi:hypothetical protein
MKFSSLCIAASLCYSLAGQANAQTAQTESKPSAGIGQLTHKVGERVDYVEDGKWFKAVITEVRDDSLDHLDGKMYAPYHVHALGYVGDHWVCCVDFADRRSQLRPAGGPTETVPGGEANDDVLKAMSGAKAATPLQPAAKEYNCEVGVPIKITGKGTYGGGTYTLDALSSTLTFKGGDYDGQRALFDMSYGVPRLHLLGPSGRPVIDCD